MAEKIDPDIVRWVWGKRSEGMAEGQIKLSLQQSGWQDEDIAKVLVQPQPDDTPKTHKNLLRTMYIAIGIFALLVGVLFLVGFGVIGNDKIEFSYQKCLDLEIPKSACESLQAMLDGQATETWVAPTSLARINQEIVSGGFLAESSISVDLDSWTPSQVLNVESATVCAESNQQNYVVLLDGSGGQWLVEAILPIDSDGSAVPASDPSYCRS